MDNNTPSKNSKGLSSRQNIVPELSNSYSPLQVEDLPQQILVEENSSIVLPEEKYTILGNVIRRRPNIYTTEKYIQTQQQLQKSKVVPRNKTYTGTLRESKKSLMIGDSHIRKVKRDKLQNSFDNAKSFVRYFSGAKTEDLHHYIISSLEAVNYYHKALHLGCCGSPRSASDIGSNNITHRTIYILFNMIYSKNEAFRDTSHHDVKYHE